MIGPHLATSELAGLRRTKTIRYAEWVPPQVLVWWQQRGWPMYVYLAEQPFPHEIVPAPPDWKIRLIDGEIRLWIVERQ